MLHSCLACRAQLGIPRGATFPPKPCLDTLIQTGLSFTWPSHGLVVFAHSRFPPGTWLSVLQCVWRTTVQEFGLRFRRLTVQPRGSPYRVELLPGYRAAPHGKGVRD